VSIGFQSVLSISGGAKNMFRVRVEIERETSGVAGGLRLDRRKRGKSTLVFGLRLGDLSACPQPPHLGLRASFSSI